VKASGRIAEVLSVEAMLGRRESTRWGFSPSMARAKSPRSETRLIDRGPSAHFSARSVIETDAGRGITRSTR